MASFSKHSKSSTSPNSLSPHLCLNLAIIPSSSSCGSKPPFAHFTTNSPSSFCFCTAQATWFKLKSFASGLSLELQGKIRFLHGLSVKLQVVQEGEEEKMWVSAT